LSRRGYASVQDAAHKASHKAGSDLPWLATSAVITVPTLSYLLFNGPEKKSHDEHAAEADDKHGVKKAKPEEEMGEPKTPRPTSGGDTGDAESKGHVVGYKPEDHKGGHEDSEEGAQPQDPKPNKPTGDDSDKKARAAEKGSDSDKKDEGSDKKDGKKSDDGSDSGSDKDSDKKQSDEKAANQKGSDENADKGKTDSSGKDSKNKGGEMDDSTDSQANKLSEKSPSKRVNPTDK